MIAGREEEKPGAEASAAAAAREESAQQLRVRVHRIRNERIENVGEYQSCMVSKLRIICKQTVR